MPEANPFEAVFGQQKPQQSQSAPVSQPTATGGNPFDTVFGPGNHTQPGQTPATSTHGAVYNAAEGVLGGDNSDKSMLPGAFGGIEQLVKGGIKGAMSTLSGVGSTINKLTGAPSDNPTTNFNQENLHGLTDSTNPLQSVGKGAEQIGEFAGGEGAIGKLGLGAAGKLAATSALGGGLSAAQSGGSLGATAIGAALPGLQQFMLTPAAKFAANAAKKVFAMTGRTGEGSIARAFLHPDDSGLVDTMRGKITSNDVVNNIEDVVTKFRDDASSAYQAAGDKINQNAIKDWPKKSFNALSDVHANLAKDLEKNFGVTQEATGEWDLHQLPPTDRKAVGELIQDVSNWGNKPNDMTPGGLIRLKQVVASYAGEGGRTGVVASRIKDNLDSHLDAIIPGHPEMNADYAKASDTLRDIKNTFNVKPGVKNNEFTVNNKIQNLFRQNTDFRENIMKKLGPEGDRLLDQIAGLHLKDVMPKGLLGTLLGVESFGAMLHHPQVGAAALAAPAFSPRAIGEGARIAGKVTQKVAQSGLPIRDTARRAVTAGANGMLSGSQ